MARFYTDEDFSIPCGDALAALGHDVLTARDAGQAGIGVPDEAVLEFATVQGRAVLTHNRRDFRRLHAVGSRHAGIIICTRDRDDLGLARRIHESVADVADLQGRLLRVCRPA